MLLDIEYNSFPEPGSAIAIELHEKKDGQYFEVSIPIYVRYVEILDELFMSTVHNFSREAKNYLITLRALM